MKFDFDRVPDRQGTNALALEGYRDYLFGEGADLQRVAEPQDLIQLWVADMQFAAAPCVIDAMRRRLDHPVFGYTANFDDQLFDAFSDWAKARYDWMVHRESFFVSLGVIPALYNLVDCLCGPGDKVLTLTPAYGFFKHAASHSATEIVSSPLQQNARFQIDFEDFETKAADPAVKLFFLCHPHNPTGQEWSEQDLRRMGEICFRYDVTIVSDEVHCDLLRIGKHHTPLARLFPGEDRIVTCMAPSKTFNIAGLMTGVVVIESENLRRKWRQRTYPFVSPLGLAAATAAYRDGAEWLEHLRTYLDGNFALLKEFLETNLPQASFHIPDATYLAWIDMRSYFPAGMNLTRYFLEKSGVILEGGEMFIDNGGGHIRLNIACPRNVLLCALKQMASVINST